MGSNDIEKTVIVMRESAYRGISMKEYRKCAREMLEFVEKSPSCFHAAANLKERLKAQGFEELKETEDWKPEAGKGYCVTRNDSSLIAFRLPEETRGIPGFHIAASHSDSPCFKLKESPEKSVEGHYVTLNTEKYGAMILSSWMDRALSVAGRVAVQGKDGIEARLVNLDKDLLVIPNLAIHMNRDMNNGVAYNPQVDMLPLFAEQEGEKKSGGLLKAVAKAAGCKREDILGHDLFLYVREKGRILGENGEFVLSPRLDDLQCAFSSFRAFETARPGRYINVCAVFDNEEVGSASRQGADSTFLEDVLWRIGESLGADRSRYLKLLGGSFLLSADNAHAVHPNHPEKADPTNRPYLNGGIVIKYHGGQKYITDGVTAARLKALCRRAGVPFQTYANRSDLAGGSTLGNISAAHVSVPGADLGLPQLAMHSAVETAGVRDTLCAVELLRTFYGE